MTVPAFTFVMAYVRSEFTWAVMIACWAQISEVIRPEARWYGYVEDDAEQDDGRANADPGP